MGKPRRFKLKREEIEELVQAEQAIKDATTRMRFVAVRLYGSGEDEAKIEEVTHSSRRSVITWCRRYGTGGVGGLLDQRAGGNHRLLQPEQIEAVIGLMQRSTPRQVFGGKAGEAGACHNERFWNVVDLKRLVERDYGVVYRHSSSYHDLLKMSGMSYQRTERYYKSRRESDKVAFEEQLEKNSWTSPRTHPTR